MDDTRESNDAEYVREGGPYADLIRDLIESGRYESAAEVVLDALSLLPRPGAAAQDPAGLLKAEIQKGIDTVRRGELIPAEEVFDRLEVKYRTIVGDSA
jgi:antitoxin ParD1/3/4